MLKITNTLNIFQPILFYLKIDETDKKRENNETDQEPEKKLHKMKITT